MLKYDYYQVMKMDILAYIDEEYTTEEVKKHLADMGSFYEKLYDDLWVCDSVTGNASGSYTFSKWKAEENICHNMDILRDALSEFCGDYADALNHGAEFCDVTIRCYLLGSVLDEVLNDLERGWIECQFTGPMIVR